MTLKKQGESEDAWVKARASGVPVPPPLFLGIFWLNQAERPGFAFPLLKKKNTSFKKVLISDEDSSLALTLESPHRSTFYGCTLFCNDGLQSQATPNRALTGRSEKLEGGTQEEAAREGIVNMVQERTPHKQKRGDTEKLN